MLDPLSINLPLSSATPPAPALPKRKLLQPSPDHPDDYILEWDYSSMSSFMECPRKAENALVHSREAARDESATGFGRLFHKVEEQRRLAGLTAETRVKQLETIVEYFIQNPVPPGDHRTSDRMMNVLQLYYEKFGADSMEKKIFVHEGKPFVERPFKIELCTIAVNADLPYFHGWLVANSNDDYMGEPTTRVRNIHIVYTGRIDCAVREPQLWVWDDKTTSRGGQQFTNAFRLSNQTRGYAWALQKIANEPVLGCIVNAVVVRPLTKTGTGTEFSRQNFFYSQDLLDEWESNAKAISSDFVNCLVRGYFPQHARSFISPCAMCDYSDNCPLPFNQRAADLASDLYRDKTWNPMWSE